MCLLSFLNPYKGYRICMCWIVTYPERAVNNFFQVMFILPSEYYIILEVVEIVGE